MELMKYVSKHHYKELVSEKDMKDEKEEDMIKEQEKAEQDNKIVMAESMLDKIIQWDTFDGRERPLMIC